MQILFVADPLESFVIYKDSTFAMMREAQRRGHQIVASVLSLSYAAPHLFGDRLDEFEAALRALLAEASPDGLFSEEMREIVADAWRPEP